MGRRKQQFKGIPVVTGVAMGRVHLKFRQTQVLSDRTLQPEEVANEIELFREAVRVCKERLLTDRAKVKTDIGELEATIFDTHLAILEDRGLIDKIQHQVSHDFKPVEVVVSVIVEGYYKALRMVQDEHIRERAADIRDVGLRLLSSTTALRGGPSPEYSSTPRTRPGDIIFTRSAAV